MIFSQASALWLASQSRYLAPGTLRNYRRIVRALELWAGKRPLAQIDKLALQEFFRSRKVSQNTAHKETQTVRSIFAFLEEQKYLAVSPARCLKAPRFRPPDNRPYTQEEIIRILAAVDTIGRHFYERQRVRAAILLMRHHALRISDVVLLRRDAVQAGRLRVITQKTKTAIDHRAVPEVVEALERLPVPLRAVEPSQFFFWSGRGSWTSTAANLSATLRSVYRASKVQGAHSHRFRHTRASEILAVGGSIEDAARFLGISPRITALHYIKFMPEHQVRIDNLMERLLCRDHNAPGGDASGRSTVPAFAADTTAGE